MEPQFLEPQDSQTGLTASHPHSRDMCMFMPLDLDLVPGILVIVISFFHMGKPGSTNTGTSSCWVRVEFPATCWAATWFWGAVWPWSCKETLSSQGPLLLSLHFWRVCDLPWHIWKTLPFRGSNYMKHCKPCYFPVSGIHVPSSPSLFAGYCFQIHLLQKNSVFLFRRQTLWDRWLPIVFPNKKHEGVYRR